MISISLDDERLAWRGIGSLETIGDAVRVWRVPHDHRQFHAPELLAVADIPTCSRIGFRTNAQFIELDVELDAKTADGPVTFEAVIDGEVVSSTSAAKTSAVKLGPLPDGFHDIELWLPNQHSVVLTGMRISDEADLTVSPMTLLRWITYGSSITQNRTAPSATATWPGIVARRNRLDVTNLGFAGQCLLDPLIAEQIARTPAEMISLCVGINIHNLASMSQRAYRSSLIGFIRTVRAGHPDTPLAVISPIASPKREHRPSHPRYFPGFVQKLLWNKRSSLPNGMVGPTLDELRQITHDVVDVLSAADPNLRLVDGRVLLGEKDASLLTDGLHPGAEGLRLMADRCEEKLLPLLRGCTDNIVDDDSGETP